MVTATVDVLNRFNQPIPCRTLLDTCSTSNFMTEKLADELGLKKQLYSIPIGVLNSISTHSSHIVTATFKSRVNEYKHTLNFLTIPEIAQLVPDQPVNRSAIKMPSNLKLADPKFHRPAPVDLLLGSGTTLSLLCIGQLGLSLPGGPDLYMQKTRLGWVIGGSVSQAKETSKASCHITSELQFNLANFWEIEEGPSVRTHTPVELKCEAHYTQHIERNREGRYVVALPFNEKISELGESRFMAAKRLKGMRRKLDHDPKLKEQYEAVMDEYISLNHMTPVSASSLNDGGYYLPHHAVIKQSSITTKVRVVYDGSAKTTTGISFNDALMVGPTIQPDLFALLLRFRKHQIILTGDIEKMYRQVLVRPEDSKYQRILWHNGDGADQAFELNTVTFGLSPAPYLAIRTLHQLAIDEGADFPLGARALKNDFYVDDALTGAETKGEAIALRTELTLLLERGGFSIRQWASNNSDILEDIPADKINLHLTLGESSTLKTLGVQWKSETDQIVYTVTPSTLDSRVTKRVILSEIARIFDPLGLLAPVIIKAKIFMQRLWSLKLDWDESLPSNVHTEWISYYKKLTLLNNISFNRLTVIPNAREIQLHGFCDASERAYGACIYLRTIDEDGHIRVMLLCAKSRVAPLKTISIPRLELCGALLLTTLATTVQTELHTQIHRIFFWTDSTIVLHWLRLPSNTLKTFVANRVSEIQQKTEIKDWRHVRSQDNPADLVSRGMGPEEFLQPCTWQNGPNWLTHQEDMWPLSHIQSVGDDLELRSAACLTTVSKSQFEILTRFSAITKLQRVIALCLRFVKKSKTKGFLTVTELGASLKVILKLTQRQAFAEEISLISGGRQLKTTNKLTRLKPFIDSDGILRVGGRLQHSTLPFSAMPPIILPKNHHVTDLIILNEHRNHLHAGTQATLYAIRRRFWPVDGRSQVWRVIKPCLTCNKVNPPSASYLMGNLPKPRVTVTRPFTHVGVDYCGPFLLKEKRFRNRNTIKAYVAVFICLSTKATHLEVVNDLTSEGFIAALRRFIARRGFCTDLYSDNGTNFIGANRELKDIVQHLKEADSKAKVHHYITNKNIEWHFIPLLSPHFGGLWEAAVKSFKYHLFRVAGVKLLFTFEEFNTLIIEIEGILNSRPLTPISSDPNDPIVLTPGHFLIGDSITNLRERDFSTTITNRLSTWQHVQKVKQDFWHRWRNDYLNELTVRSKWTQHPANIKIGALVLLKDDHVPPPLWIMGRVTECHPGSDGVVRVVTIKTPSTTLKRNITKVAPLPVNLSEDQPDAPSIL